MSTGTGTHIIAAAANVAATACAIGKYLDNIALQCNIDYEYYDAIIVHWL